MCMNSKSKSIVYTSVFMGLALSSCVPQRKFDELKTQYDKCQETSNNCKQELSTASAQLTDCNALATQLKTKVLSLEADSLECFTALERTKKLYQQSEETAQRIIENSRYENGRLSTDLNAKNEALKNKERELHEQEASLIAAQNKNRELAANLALREKRVAELEWILKSKDSAVLALKASIQKALLGFQNQGLSIEIKNGKVYVSMEEKLLFRSGSVTVDPEGEKALMALAKALNTYEEVSILVEGHTDNVPMKSSTIKDNLDLSVLRATSITRLLTANGKVDPKRVTSAGRGEYFPIDAANTPEARAKNRRTDIILTPKLDELLSILNSQ